MWTTNAYLQDAIASKNYIRIHNELCSIIHKDPVFRTGDFETALQYVMGFIPDVIKEHDNAPPLERELWNDDYWALVVSELMDNFSLNRIEHVKQVGRYLKGWTNTATHVQSPIKKEEIRTKTPLNHHKPLVSSHYKPVVRVSSGRFPSKGNTRKKIGAATLVAGIVVAGVAAIGFKKMALVAGAVILIGGALFIMMGKRR
ncbi:hypothetical protein [Paenibacillus sp. JDR-2]|uniref:hypothetical protein n=1 Tax=Paenibacillus sp. (strain JDR-2) TaxID=324057 RepID=UPI000166A217|nr:hypothetical protein [Paenibacillus sp. JDR-2]ACT00497.1 hypothetical protein Pjdr2_1838 [Paenibacillus sp. JDR-2]